MNPPRPPRRPRAPLHDREQNKKRADINVASFRCSFRIKKVYLKNSNSRGVVPILDILATSAWAAKQHKKNKQPRAPCACAASIAGGRLNWTEFYFSHKPLEINRVLEFSEKNDWKKKKKNSVHVTVCRGVGMCQNLWIFSHWCKYTSICGFRTVLLYLDKKMYRPRAANRLFGYIDPTCQAVIVVQYIVYRSTRQNALRRIARGGDDAPL